MGYPAARPGILNKPPYNTGETVCKINKNSVLR